MQKHRVRDSPKSYRKSVAKTVSRVLGKCSSLGGKRKALKHTFRAAFGLHLLWLKGVFSFLVAACQWEQPGAALRRRERVEPSSPTQALVGRLR